MENPKKTPLLQGNSTQKKLKCIYCGTNFQVYPYPYLKNQLKQEISNSKGAKIVKLIREITDCSLNAAFTIHQAYKEVSQEASETPETSQTSKFPFITYNKLNQMVILTGTTDNPVYNLKGIVLDENKTWYNNTWTKNGHFVSKVRSEYDLINLP